MLAVQKAGAQREPDGLSGKLLGRQKEIAPLQTMSSFGLCTPLAIIRCQEGTAAAPNGHVLMLKTLELWTQGF